MNADILGEFIGLVSAILFLSIPIVYIILRSRRLQKAMELLHTERMAAIERGMDLPASSLEILGDQIARSKRPRTALLPGLVWLFVGVAIALSRLTIDGNEAPLMVGLIPAGIGLAYLIYYFLEERKQLEQQRTADQQK
jgi:4-hydroxybenzoate polyprenyltransferase